MLRSALPSPLPGFTCHPSVLAPALLSCHHARCSPETTQRSFTFRPTLHPQGTALGTPSGPLGVPAHMLSCPPRDLHPRLSLIPSVPVPFPAAMPILQKLAAPSRCSGLCTALCLCSAHSCPKVAPQSWHQLQCPPASTSHTVQRLPTAPPASLTVQALPHTMLLRPIQFQPSGHGALRRRGLREVLGNLCPRVQQPDPVGSLSPHVLGSEPCSLFLVVHQPQLSLPFVLILLTLPPRNSCHLAKSGGPLQVSTTLLYLGI